MVQIDTAVKLAYDNLGQNPWFKQTERYARYWSMISKDNQRRIVVIYDNLGNCWAFYVNRYKDIKTFEGFIYHWERVQVLPKTQLAKWILDNC